jgi:hypothetical protein
MHRTSRGNLGSLSHFYTKFKVRSPNQILTLYFLLREKVASANFYRIFAEIIAKLNTGLLDLLMFVCIEYSWSSSVCVYVYIIDERASMYLLPRGPLL